MLKYLVAGIGAVVVLAGVAAAAPLREDINASISRRDYAEATQLTIMFAEQGDAISQYILGNAYSSGGNMYSGGQDVPPSDGKAARWYRSAAEQGYLLAQSALAWMYLRGDGVPQDYVLAHMWFSLAAAQGSNSAKEQRDIVADRMTPDQIAEAQRMAREWKPVPER